MKLKYRPSLQQRLLDFSRSLKQFMEHMWYDSDPLLLAKTLIVWLILFFCLFVRFFLGSIYPKTIIRLFLFFSDLFCPFFSYPVLFLFFESFTLSSDCTCCSSLDFSASHSRIILPRSSILIIEGSGTRLCSGTNLLTSNFFLTIRIISFCTPNVTGRIFLLSCGIT